MGALADKFMEHLLREFELQKALVFIYVSKLSSGVLKERMSEGIAGDSDLKYALDAVIDAARDLATRFDADRVPLST